MATNPEDKKIYSNNKSLPMAENDLRILSSDLKRRVLLLEKQLEEEKGRADTLQAQLDCLHSSPSWRYTEPLRKVRRVFHKMFPLIRFQSASFKIDPAKGEKFYSYYSATKLPVPHGRCILRLKVSNPAHIYISFDRGSGITDEWKQFVNMVPERGWSVIAVPHATVGIRLDCSDSKALGEINEFSVRALGKLEVAFFWGFQKLGKDPRFWWPKLKKAYKAVRIGGIGALRAKLADDYQEWVEKYDRLSTDDIKAIKNHISQLKNKPLISVLLPVYNTPEQWLRAAIESVVRQIYDNWELCIADDCSTMPHVKAVIEEYKKRESRIRSVFRTQNGHISEATNSALSIATGEYVALLDHDDELREHGLYMNVVEINEHPEAALIYSDEDKITTYGMRFNPYFKSDWNPELFLQQNFICHLTVMLKSVVDKVGGFRKGFEGSQDWDLMLRVIDEISSDRIRHIPHILYHWRSVEGSTAQAAGFKPYALEAGARAIREHLVRKGVSATVELLPEIAHYKINYSLPEKLPLVSIIIPTRDKVDVLARCVESLLRKTTYPNFEIIIMDNGSVEEDTKSYFDDLAVDPRVSIVRDDRPFNFSAINNFGVSKARGELIAFLNNDLEVITPEWLSEMVSLAVRPENGCVGARLWFPNELLQHAGVIVGIGGVGGHNHKGIKRGDVGYFNRAILTQNFSAVTAACLVCRREVFSEVGGFDEENFAVAFNDVDLCLRIRKKGYLNVWTPFAELYHYESISRGYEHTHEKFKRFEKETLNMKLKWGNVLDEDPYYNPNLTIRHEDFRLAYPPRARKPWLS